MKIILDLLPRSGPELEHNQELLDRIEELLTMNLGETHYVEVYPFPQTRLSNAITEATGLIETIESANFVAVGLRDHLTRLKEEL